jgi:hypothetical protein
MDWFGTFLTFSEEDSETDLLESLRKRKANSQNLTMLFLGTLRSLGFHARYVAPVRIPKVQIKKEEISVSSTKNRSSKSSAAADEPLDPREKIASEISCEVFVEEANKTRKWIGNHFSVRFSFCSVRKE